MMNGGAYGRNYEGNGRSHGGVYVTNYEGSRSRNCYGNYIGNNGRSQSAGQGGNYDGPRGMERPSFYQTYQIPLMILGSFLSGALLIIGALAK